MLVHNKNAWDPEVSETIQKLLEGTGQLRNLRNNPNFHGVNIEYLLQRTPAELEQLAKSGIISSKTLKHAKTNKKSIRRARFGNEREEMLMEDGISINMYFCRSGQHKPDIIKFDPNEYFDLEDDTSPDIDSVPKYLNMLDYLEEKDNVTYIAVVITNKNNGKKLHIETNFFNGQQSTLSIRTEYHYDLITYKEVITDVLLPSEENNVTIHDVCRFCLKDCYYNCIYHGIIKKGRDGTETEYRLI